MRLSRPRSTHQVLGRSVLLGIGITLVAAATLALVVAAALPARAQEAPAGARIQVAILLDTSNSMDGLIDQARSQLWELVNELLEARRNGHRPAVELALYEYGNTGLNAAGGYVRKVLDLTDDIDRVSEALFALRTNGGEEYCGQVIWDAVHDLGWDDTPDTLRIVYIAGNEPFTQGTLDYRQACRAAVDSGVIVNTIHCGDRATGASTGWRDGALLAEGTYLSIDQSQKAVHIPAPQDDEIALLDRKLNDTYLPYGDAGAEGQQLQEAQDANAAAASTRSLLARAKFKASAAYSASRWDLVDAHEQHKVDLAELEPDQLPKELRSMTPAELEAHVEQLSRERAEVKQRIQKLTTEREHFLAKARREHADGDSQRLDQAMLETLRTQATAKGFTFEPGS